MKILNFKAENFKKLVAVEITPDGHVVQITGKNGAGKTSILDGIMAALGGASVIQAKPIRKGQDRAQVTLDLGDIIVERKFKDKDGKVESALEIRNKEGAKFGSPQKMLDELVGRLSFDPLEFMRQSPAEQFKTLREMLGLDFSQLDLKRQAAYDRRTDHGRQYRSLLAQKEAIRFDPDGAKATVSANELLDEYQQATAVNAGIEDAKQRLAEGDRDVRRAEAEIAELEDRIAEYRERIAAIKTRRPNIEAIANQQPRDLAEIKARINGIEAANKNAEQYQKWVKLGEEVAAVEALGKACAAEIETVDAQKADLISSATMPVKGLQFGEGIVLFNGIPLEQASAAEQLRVSVAMAMAMNPKLRVLRVTDGSLLDSDSLKALEAMALDSDYQVWIERVDESGQVGIVIEDGQVKNPQPAQSSPAA
jgi:DNA repair exonuclease SbcCD ATPase subunit